LGSLGELAVGLLERPSDGSPELVQRRAVLVHAGELHPRWLAALAPTHHQGEAGGGAERLGNLRQRLLA
jgi:hypothetical protein